MHNYQVCLILLAIFFSLAIGLKTNGSDENCSLPGIDISCYCTKSYMVDRRNGTLHFISKTETTLFRPRSSKCHLVNRFIKICKLISKCQLIIKKRTDRGPVIASRSRVMASNPPVVASNSRVIASNSRVTAFNPSLKAFNTLAMVSHSPFNASQSSPIQIFIPKGVNASKLRFRSVRDANMCQIKGLNHADIKCWRWPAFIDCLINCSIGYALRSDEGSMLSKGISCTYDDNRWWPHGFQECEPYINCNAHLVSAGSLKCHTPLNEPPYCDIACLDYEGKEGTKPGKYVCTDENFESTLPHCARLNKYEPLLEKPNKPKVDYNNDMENEI